MERFADAYDVIVAGGGPAGIAAAVASARQGARTALVERYGILGGMATSGQVDPILGAVGPGTMYDEITAALGQHTAATRNGREISFDPEQAKSYFLELAAGTGVDVFLQTPVVDVIHDGGKVSGLLVCAPNGPRTLTARVVVDATGDGYAACRAGARYAVGRAGDGRCQPASVEFTIDGVDEGSAITCWGGSDPVALADGTRYAELCRRCCERGELPENVSIVRLHRTGYPGERSVNATQANGCDTLTPEGLLEAELTLRRQIDPIIAFLRKYVPGYGNCKRKSTGSSLGVRESRRILGDYVLADSDVENGVRQPDVAVHNAWFLIDIHNPAGGGQAEGRSQPARPYDIPYRCLLPQGVENMLTCGRCISGTHRAHASYRVMGICFATGQAAGIAAALSALSGAAPRQLPAAALQEALERQGAVLFDV